MRSQSSAAELINVPPLNGSPTIGRVSVIIANYNYEQYVCAAIESALDLDWPDVEVIVVDDGSTDGSREVIEGFGDRIRTIYQDNATQRVARNRGYAMSTGDAVIHLDSDDVLVAGLVRRVNRVWGPGVSKVQVQMESIDGAGRPLGKRFPKFHRVPRPAEMRYWVERTSAHPTPPGSGNVYSRAFLDRIFPLDDRCGPATDSACLIAAPLLGDVVTVPEPLVQYRVHGNNTSDMLARRDSFSRAVARGRARYFYGRSLVSDDPAPDERPLFRSRELLQLRVAASRLTPIARPIPSDSTLRRLRDVVLNLFSPGPDPVGTRIAIAAWCLAVIGTPATVAERLVELRYRRA